MSTILLVDTIFGTAQNRIKTVLTGRLPFYVWKKKEIDSVLDAPDVELSGIIRKNAKLVEMRAYLRGLSFRAVSDQNVPPVI